MLRRRCNDRTLSHSAQKGPQTVIYEREGTLGR
jgi:hypothetical protein